MQNLTLASDLAQKIRAAWFTISGLDHEERPDFRDQLLSVQGELSERWSGKKPSEIPLLEAGRKLYRAAGMDPTRTRPSSEALLRRVLQGKGLYRLDPIVDTGNLFSMENGLPLGLYDLSAISGDCELRFGREGEGFAGIRKDRVNVSGRLCIADAEGPFGSPSSDSHRCRIREETNESLALLYAPAEYPLADFAKKINALAVAFARWNGGTAGSIALLP